MINQQEERRAMVEGVARRVANIMEHGPNAIRDRGDVLLYAYTLTMGSRNRQNGDALTNSESSAALWEQYLAERNSDVSHREQQLAGRRPLRVSGADFGIMMVLMKISRFVHGEGKLDDFIDICGYACMAAECWINNR